MVNIKHMPSMSPVSRFPGIRYERVPVARGVNHMGKGTSINQRVNLAKELLASSQENGLVSIESYHHRE